MSAWGKRIPLTPELESAFSARESIVNTIFGTGLGATFAFSDNLKTYSDFPHFIATFFSFLLFSGLVFFLVFFARRASLTIVRMDRIILHPVYIMISLLSFSSSAFLIIFSSFLSGFIRKEDFIFDQGCFTIISTWMLSYLMVGFLIRSRRLRPAPRTEA